LLEQIEWYDRNAASNQKWFKVIKVVQVVLGSLVPVVATAGGARWVLGALGAGVVILEAVQQLFQFHRNWISYRATCEALRREQHLCLVGAGVYAKARNPVVMLAERLESLVGRETAEWASASNALGEATKEREP
jgi:protein-S-isoprenylcysteine O-methyltransferase Ste14